MTLKGFQFSEQELPGAIVVALLERLVRFPPQEVGPKIISQSVLSYGVLHSTGKAAAVSERLQQGLLQCVAQKSPLLSAEQLGLCVVGLSKLHWGFGAALGPLQEAAAAAAAAGPASAGSTLKDITSIRTGLFIAGQPLGVAEDALQRRQAQLQKRNHDVAVKM